MWFDLKSAAKFPSIIYIYFMMMSNMHSLPYMSPHNHGTLDI